MANLTPTGQVLYILSALRHQHMLTVREKNLLKGMLLRRDERVYEVTQRAPDGGFEAARDQLRGLAVEEAEQRYNLVMEVFESEAASYMAEANEARADIAKANPTLDAQSLVYGEVDFAPFVAVLQQLQVPMAAKFVDLGSGCGKALLAASLLVDFEELHGVEVVGPLYDASQSVLGTFRKLEGDMHELPEDAVPITLHHADMLKWDWTWADVVFANATCFSPQLVGAIADKAALLKPGSLIVTITQRLTHPSLELVAQSKKTMSWGSGTFYVHRRKESTPTATLRPSISISREPSPAHASALQMMSSPQGAALLEAKRRRRAAQSASAAGSGAGAGAGAGAPGASAPAGSPRKRVRPGAGDPRMPNRLQFSPTLRMEMDAGFRPSSPQGDALLAAKQKRYQRAALQG